MSMSRVTAVWLPLTIFVVTLSSIVQAQSNPCPKGVPAKPNWFRGFWVPRPKGKLLVSIEVPTSDIDCTSLPMELTVPNKQEITLDITYPAAYACATTLSENPAATSNPAQDLIAAFSKAGVLPFAAMVTTAPKKYTRDLPALSSEVLTATVTCKGEKDRTLVQKVNITYQNPPRVTASAGMVIARGVASYGVKTMVTGTSNGIVTTQNTVAVTSLPSAQVVPFTFANIYLVGSPSKHIDAQLGFGVNPNLSTPRIEFFASPFTFSWHDVYLSPGIHIGEHEQLTNGFAVGNVLPNGVGKTPINWKFYAGFGFSLSYNLHPLVKGK